MLFLLLGVVTFKDLIYKEQKALHFLRGEAVFLSLYRKTTSIDKSTHLFLLGACSILKLISASHLLFTHSTRISSPEAEVTYRASPQGVLTRVFRFYCSNFQAEKCDGSGLPLNCILGSVFALLCGFSAILWLLGLWAECWFSEMVPVKRKR